MKIFFLIGAMKSATSSLHACLKCHPQLYACAIKEPRFFLHEHATDREWQSYLELFKGRTNEVWQFESTTGYSKYPSRSGVPQRIHSRFPDARFVYIVRDPIARIYSHYLHNYSRGRETLSFADAVRQNKEYIDISRYSMQISEYLKHYDRRQLCIVTMEEFSRSKPEVLRRIFQFLEVDADFVSPNTEHVVNRTATQRMLPQWLQRLDFKTKSIQTALARRKYVGAILRRAAAPIALLSRPVPSIGDIRDAAAEQYIRDMLGDDLAQLREFLGRDLDEWPTVCATEECRRVDSAIASR